VPGGLGTSRASVLGGGVWRWFRGWLLPAFLVTLAATLGTYPVLAYHFNRVSVVGLVANLVVVPLTGVVVPFLLGASLALSVSETLARALLFPADLVLSLMVAAARFFSSLPHASVSVSTPTLVEIILFYLLVLVVANLKRGRLYRRLALALLLLLVLDLGYWAYGRRFGDTLKATFISVGQGDSALIEFPGGTVMLIDGGGFYGGFDPGERIVAPLLRGKKIRRIDYMVLSHAQHDHMGGLGFIARNFNVKEFWWNGVGDLGGLVGALQGSGALIREIGSGTRIPPIGGVHIEVLHPEPGLDLDLNDMSLVLKLSYGSKSFLFMGDIGEEAEAGLVSRVSGLGATVLKSPHHGSRTSSSEALLGASRSAAAIISVGRANVFGFPHRATLERYSQAGMEVYRTDLDGAVEVSTDGARLRVVTYAVR
jgi:competence protein ComEC